MNRGGGVIEYRQGDILDEQVDALVNTVNCVGVMGRGIALQFKKAWPDNFAAYEAACQRSEVQPGRMFVFETCRLTPPRYIINFPTKRHWKGKSRMGDIESGLADLVDEIRRLRIGSIAIPPLGAGLGGLHWPDVRARIECAMVDMEDVRVVVFEPHGRPVGRSSIRSKRVPDMTPGRAAIIGLMDRYLAGLMDTSVSLLEIHKLMYFMQEAGEPLRLKFAKGPYGPYSENLRHAIIAIDGYYVSGYGSGGDEPTKPISLVPGAVEEARTFLGDREDTRQRFERVADLVNGFESPTGLELLATVHWLVTRENVVDEAILPDSVHAWADSKRRLSPEQISLARNVLDSKGWLGGSSLS